MSPRLFKTFAVVKRHELMKSSPLTSDENTNSRTNNNLTVQKDELVAPGFGFSVPRGHGFGAVSFPRQLMI